MQKKIRCPFCHQVFTIALYFEDGEFQELIYDCEICCHPIEIKAEWLEQERKFRVDIAKSGGFN